MVPDPEEALVAAAAGEGGIALEEEFVEGAALAGFEARTGIDGRLELEGGAVAGLDAAVDAAGFVAVVVGQTALSIGETVEPGSEEHAERVGQPLGEEVDAVAGDVGADVEEAVRGEAGPAEGEAEVRPSGPIGWE